MIATVLLFIYCTVSCSNFLVSNAAYLVGYWGSGVVENNYYMWKICLGEPHNLANWPAEFGKICHGKLVPSYACKQQCQHLVSNCLLAG